MARLDGDGRVSTRAIARGLHPESTFLAEVVRAIGDRQRVVILGPSSVRLALEREYVSIFQRPERLVDVEPSARLEVRELVERVRALAA